MIAAVQRLLLAVVLAVAAAGAVPAQAAVTVAYGVDAGLRDPSGNHIRLVQRNDDPGY